MPDPAAEVLSPPGGRDSLFNVSATAMYALSLGVATVAFPLYALQVGYDAAVVAAIVASSAVAQILGRSAMGLLLRMVADKHLIVAAAAALALSSAMLLLTSALWLIALSQLIQGVSRALFWTANQTHAVRSHDSAVRGLSLNTFWNGVGSLCGPLVCGALLTFLPIQAPLAASAASALLATVPGALLRRLRPFRKLARDREGRRTRPLWARRELLPAFVMTTGAGIWRGLLNSLVPIVLVHAGHADADVSLLMTYANAAVLLTPLLARSLLARGQLTAAWACLGPIAVGTAAIGIVPGNGFLAACALFLSGIGGGLAQTLGAAAAADAVHDEERGQAIASSGLFRAVALFATPLAGAVLVIAVPAAAALLVISAVSAVPGIALVVTRVRSRQRTP
jgi:MFS family permease